MKKPRWQRLSHGTLIKWLRHSVQIMDKIRQKVNDSTNKYKRESIPLFEVIDKAEYVDDDNNESYNCFNSRCSGHDFQEYKKPK